MNYLIVRKFTGVSISRLTSSKREIGIQNFFMPEPRKEGNKILFWVSGINLRIGVVTKIVLLGLLYPILRRFILPPPRIRLEGN